ncbi:MAG: ATP-binding protein [Sedimentibacter sp.]
MSRYKIKNRIVWPDLSIKNHMVFNVNDKFEKLTGFLKEEIIGKSTKELCKMLRIDPQTNLENVENTCNCFIFTKNYQPREVTISIKNIGPNEKKLYIKEVANSRLEDKLPFITSIMQCNEKGIAVYSGINGIILKTNEKFLSLNIFKNNTNNCVGMKIKEALTKFKCYDLENYVLTVIKTGKAHHKNGVKYSASNTRYMYLDISLYPIYFKGDLKYIVHTINDVTERVASRKIIEKQNKEFEAILENMSDELVIFNKDFEFIAGNKLAKDNPLLYYNKTIKVDEMYKQAKFYRNVQVYDEIGNKIDFDNFPLKRIIKGEKFLNYRYIIKDDTIVLNKEISGTPIYDSEGNFIAGVVVYRDITERLKQEENLYIRAQYETLNRIIENLDLGFVRISYPEFNYININQKAYKLLKEFNPQLQSPSAVKGESIFSINFQESFINRIIEKFSSKKISTCTEIYEFNIEGEDVFSKFIYQPLYGLNNEIVEIIIISIDITEEFKAKEKMKEAIKIQDEIYANVAHELKTPLNVLFSANQMMSIYLQNDNLEINKEKFISYNSNIKQNCYRLIKIVNNIVDLSKGKAGFLELNLSNENIVEIVENIAQSVSTYVNSKGIRIIFDTDVEEKIIACDPSLIERIILNLISNAVKFSNSNSEIFINLYDKNDCIEINVKDNGVGIERKYLSSIFKRFYQVDKTLSRNSEGSGIGLSLVKTFVEMHYGKISVESEVGKGSTFKIELPAIKLENINNGERINNVKKSNYRDDKIEMINLEFSDIYELKN